MLPQNQIENIKQQLFSQLDSTNLPNKEEIKQSIKAMNAEQLEEFLKQNNLIKSSHDNTPPGVGGRGDAVGNTSAQQQCIFCSIVSGQAQSYKIDENKDAIAILEINPISKAHSLIIPKQHISSGDKLPVSANSLAKKISKKIMTKFKPKDVETHSSNLFGHEIINILPIYENETLGSPRQKANPQELAKLQKQLEKKSRPKTIKKPKTEKLDKKLWLPKRIP